MTGVRLVGGVDRFTDEVNAFAASIDDAEARWRYAARVSPYRFYSERHDRWFDSVNQKAVPALSRLLGVSPWTVRNRLQRILRDGFDEALAYGAEYDAKRVTDILKPYFAVGPLPIWCFGHVYFARVETHPHVVKVGFSRRVRARLEDIASKHRVTLTVPEEHLKVGTQADEHFWHTNWGQHRISGEWFFDPGSKDRSLPTFLQMAEAA